MQKFPGKTPEELDQIDWARLQAAWDVGEVVEIERRRSALLDGSITGADLTEYEAEAIVAHDELMEQYGNLD